MIIESLGVIAVIIYLIWLVRKSRKYNQRISKLSAEEKSKFIDHVNNDHEFRHTLAGGSVTKLPIWVVIVVLLLFGLAFWVGLR